MSLRTFPTKQFIQLIQLPSSSYFISKPYLISTQHFNTFEQNWVCTLVIRFNLNPDYYIKSIKKSTALLYKLSIKLRKNWDIIPKRGLVFKRFQIPFEHLFQLRRLELDKAICLPKS